MEKARPRTHIKGHLRKKCSGVSSSIEQRQTGFTQLNFLLKRCDLKSLCPTRIHVSSFNPYLSLTSKVPDLHGLIDERSFDLRGLKSRALRLGSSLSHLE